jgi:hypothetical protein
VKRARKVVHEFWSGDLRGNSFRPTRGCLRKIVELGGKGGDLWSSERVSNENHRSLTANIGDRFLAFGASIDEIQILEVMSIKLDGYRAEFVVSRGIGAVNDGAVKLHKLAAGRAA